MGLTAITTAEIQRHLPGRILSLGYPDHLEGHVNMAGSTLTCVDIIAHHGTEIVADLSLPQDLGLFDVVVDCGTLEHCANIAQGFLNAASAVRPGGHIIHELPINMINHGYWNVCPVWFQDFYRHNGFAIERLDCTVSDIFDRSSVTPWPCANPGENCYVMGEPRRLTLCVARRTSTAPATLPKCQEMWLK